mmetsp:Transcript_18228/g.42444  ORF Transcript_18228/g.42444 Transcript_18228/m.42444 type:complete len:202 (-) Transcript_18228:4811-5416(-)
MHGSKATVKSGPRLPAASIYSSSSSSSATTDVGASAASSNSSSRAPSGSTKGCLGEPSSFDVAFCLPPSSALTAFFGYFLYHGSGPGPKSMSTAGSEMRVKRIDNVVTAITTQPRLMKMFKVQNSKKRLLPTVEMVELMIAPPTSRIADRVRAFRTPLFFFNAIRTSVAHFFSSCASFRCLRRHANFSLKMTAASLERAAL